MTFISHRQVIAGFAAAASGAWWGLQAHAQPLPGAEASTAACAPEDTECVARKRREAQRRAPERQDEGVTGLAGGGVAIVPCVGTSTGGVCGSSTFEPDIRRGPLSVRRFEISAGVDHALSDRWAVGALIGLGRGRLHRMESEASAAASVPPTERDTTIRTRSTTLAATLTWFPAPDVWIDGALAVQQTSFDFERVDTTGNQSRAFFGDNAGRNWGLTLTAARAWRGDGYAVIPQVGLEYTVSRVDALNASIADAPAGSLENFRVSDQRAKTLTALLGAQVQWPRSVGAGVATPYLRATWRQRLSHSSDPVSVTAPGPLPVVVDLESQTPRQAATVAAGLLMQLSGGVSLFGDLGYTRGRGDLRETRLSLGVKFEI